MRVAAVLLLLTAGPVAAACVAPPPPPPPFAMANPGKAKLRDCSKGCTTAQIRELTAALDAHNARIKAFVAAANAYDRALVESFNAARKHLRCVIDG